MLRRGNSKTKLKSSCKPILYNDFVKNTPRHTISVLKINDVRLSYGLVFRGKGQAKNYVVPEMYAYIFLVSLKAAVAIN